MSNLKPSPKAQRLLREFARACEELSWIGNKPPEEHEDIRIRYLKASQKLRTYIALLEQGEEA